MIISTNKIYLCKRNYPCHMLDTALNYYFTSYILPKKQVGQGQSRVDARSHWSIEENNKCMYLANNLLQTCHPLPMILIITNYNRLVLILI